MCLIDTKFVLYIFTGLLTAAVKKKRKKENERERERLNKFQFHGVLNIYVRDLFRQ